MGRKTVLAALLNATELQNCCVLNPYGSINTVQDARKNTWGNAYHAKNKSMVVDKTTLTNPVNYMAKGKSLAACMPWAGVCQTFACASAYIIRDAGLQSVELCSFGSSFTGHVFLVVDRLAATNIANPAGWGNALVVDQWYASQVGTPNTPVFKPADAYWAWLNGKQPIKHQLQVI